jgi:hypothetical protein
MQQDHGFAEVWTSAQQARSAYLSLWVSLVWSWLRTSTPSPTLNPASEIGAENETLRHAA